VKPRDDNRFSHNAGDMAVEALKKKGSLFDATSAQDPYLMAQKAVEAGYAVFQGQKPQQGTILIPVRLISRDNVSDYPGWTR